MESSQADDAVASVDELLTLDEAGAILGVTKMTTYRMAVDGILTREDDRRWKNRQVHRSSVERVAVEWGRRLTVAAAAAMLDVGIDKVHELLRDGTLPRHPYGPGPIAIDDVQCLIDSQALADPVHEGRIPAAEAGKLLGNNRPARLAKAGRIAAMKDRQGRWWFRPEHIDMYVRARAAERDNKRRASR